MNTGLHVVDVEAGPDEHDRFLVYIAGGMMRRTLEQIKADIARGVPYAQRLGEDT